MGGITLEEFTQSRAYREIFGEGEARGEAIGKAIGKALGEANVILRLLNCRCGPLGAATTAYIEALSLRRELLLHRVALQVKQRVNGR